MSIPPPPPPKPRVPAIIGDPQARAEAARAMRSLGIGPPDEPTAEPEPDEASKIRRGVIRRKVGNQPGDLKIMWGELENLYVFGETRTLSNGALEKVYPTVRELAELFNVSERTIRMRMARDCWHAKRDKHSARLSVELEHVAAEVAAAPHRVSVMERVSESVDSLLDKFADAVAQGHIKITSTRDLRDILSLRRDLVADAEKEKESADLDLDDLVERRRRVLAERATLPDLGRADKRGVPAVLPMEVGPDGTFASKRAPSPRRKGDYGEGVTVEALPDEDDDEP